jgi:hypothetical protein
MPMKNQRANLERRRFLRAVGASALTYPFVRGLPSYAAAATEPPRYLILLFSPTGFVRHLWGAPGAKPGATPTVTPILPGTFRPSFTPLEPLRQKVIVLDGLANQAAMGPVLPDATQHETGMASLWTGVSSGGAPAGAPSIDQVIARQLQSKRPFETLELMARSTDDWSAREVKTRMIYSGPGAFKDPYDNPIAARAALFPTTPTTTTGLDRKTAIRQKLIGGSMGQLNRELTSLRQRLCTDDRAQLDVLQSSWNELDQQLTAVATAAQRCTPPGPPPASYVSPSPDFPTSVRLQMDILKLALACDLTRVASLQLSTATSQVTHTWASAGQVKVHHDYSHEGPTSLAALGPDIYSSANASLYTSLAQLSAIDLWYTQQVAYLATELAKLSPVGGGNLLDQSAIVWGTEIDIGAAHDHDDTPFVIIGGCGGRLKTGQVVRFPLKLDADPTTSNVVDRAHNDLLITVAQAMGVSLPTFGDASLCRGPLREILA